MTAEYSLKGRVLKTRAVRMRKQPKNLHQNTTSISKGQNSKPAEVWISKQRIQTDNFRCLHRSCEWRLHCRRFVSQVKWSPSLYSCKTHWHKCTITCFVGLRREISAAISAVSTEVAESSIFMHSSLSKCKVTCTRKVTFTAQHCTTVKNVRDALL